MGLRAVNKSSEKYNPGLAKRRALFPEGRGLGVGGKRKKNGGVTVRGLGVGGRKKRKQKRKALGEHQWIDIHRSKTKGGSNQTANFRKPKIIMILEMMLGYINNASFNVVC